MLTAFGIEHVSKADYNGPRDGWTEPRPRDNVGGPVYNKKTADEWSAQGLKVTAQPDKNGKTRYARVGVHPNKTVRTGLLRRKTQRPDFTQVRYQMAKSAFGVVDKRETVPDWATSALPASSVMAYNRSKKHKGQAMASNLAAKTTGSAAGTVAGALAMGIAAKRVPALRTLTRGSKVLGRAISADRKLGAAQAAAGGVVGGVAGGITGNRSLNRIKGDKRYGYQ